jgi:lactoylglutathione lyase
VLKVSHLTVPNGSLSGLSWLKELFEMKKFRHPLILSLAAFLPGCLFFLQSGIPHSAPQFDHTALHVRDLQKSSEFYAKVMRLEKMPEPFKDGRHIWFRIGPHDQLHVIAGATDATEHPIDVHLAFRVSSLPEFMTHLNQMQVSYRSFKGDDKTVTVRPDGVKQVYLQDPDGYWIEVNDVKF